MLIHVSYNMTFFPSYLRPVGKEILLDKCFSFYLFNGFCSLYLFINRQHRATDVNRNQTLFPQSLIRSSWNEQWWVEQDEVNNINITPRRNLVINIKKNFKKGWDLEININTCISEQWDLAININLSEQSDLVININIAEQSDLVININIAEKWDLGIT